MVSRTNWRTILSTLTIVFFVLGCAKAPNTLQHSKTKTIFFSTKNFKFYDLGFIKTYANSTSLEIFNAGSALLKMDCYPNKICLNSKCYSKDSITRFFFDSNAFKELDFQAVLKKQEIFNGENKVEIQDGFLQNITRDGLTLNYKIIKDSIELEIKNLHKKTIFLLQIH